MKTILISAILIAGAIGVISLGAMESPAQNLPQVKAIRMEDGLTPKELDCIECHQEETPLLFTDWPQSQHANANVTCLNCHIVEAHDEDVGKNNMKQDGQDDKTYETKAYRLTASAEVMPKDCWR